MDARIVLFIWLGFIVFILLILALDLGVFHRKAHVVRLKVALAWSAARVTMLRVLSGFVYFAYERHWAGLPPAGDTTSVVASMLSDRRCQPTPKPPHLNKTPPSEGDGKNVSTIFERK